MVGSSGQSAEDLAQALADEVNANPTLAAARIYGLASGDSFVTTGTIESVELITLVPTLPFWGLSLLITLLLAAGLRAFGEESSAGSSAVS